MIDSVWVRWSALVPSAAAGEFHLRVWLLRSTSMAASKDGSHLQAEEIAKLILSRMGNSQLLPIPKIKQQGREWAKEVLLPAS